VQVQFM